MRLRSIYKLFLAVILIAAISVSMSACDLLNDSEESKVPEEIEIIAEKIDTEPVGIFDFRSSEMSFIVEGIDSGRLSFKTETAPAVPEKYEFVGGSIVLKDLYTYTEDDTLIVTLENNAGEELKNISIELEEIEDKDDIAAEENIQVSETEGENLEDILGFFVEENYSEAFYDWIYMSIFHIRNMEPISQQSLLQHLEENEQSSYYVDGKVHEKYDTWARYKTVSHDKLDGDFSKFYKKVRIPQFVKAETDEIIKVPGIDPLTLTLGVEKGEGTITKPGEGHYGYEEGEKAQVEAKPAAGWEFYVWTGEDVDKIAENGIKEPEVSFIMEEDTEIKAYFTEEEEEKQEVNIDSEAYIGEAGEARDKTGHPPYPAGFEIELEAEAPEGSTFSHWSLETESSTTEHQDLKKDDLEAEKEIPGEFEGEYVKTGGIDPTEYFEDTESAETFFEIPEEAFERVVAHFTSIEELPEPGDFEYNHNDFEKRITAEVGEGYGVHYEMWDISDLNVGEALNFYFQARNLPDNYQVYYGEESDWHSDDYNFELIFDSKWVSVRPEEYIDPGRYDPDPKPHDWHRNVEHSMEINFNWTYGDDYPGGKYENIVVKKPGKDVLMIRVEGRDEGTAWDYKLEAIEAPTSPFTLEVGDQGTVEVEKPDGTVIEVEDEYELDIEGTKNIKLAAEPYSAKWKFYEWTGDYTGEDEEVEIEASNNMRVNAEFRGDVFKVINSWGDDWGPLSDGSFYMTYGAAKNAGHDIGWRNQDGTRAFIMEPVKYEPSAIAEFSVTGDRRNDWDFTVKVDDGWFGGEEKSFYDSNMINKSGHEDIEAKMGAFAQDTLVIDITELMPFEENEEIILEVNNESNQMGYIHEYILDIEDNIYQHDELIQVPAGDKKEIKIEIDGPYESARALARSGELEAVSRELTREDVREFAADERKVETATQSVRGHDTGLRPMTVEHWEEAKEDNLIKVLEAEKIIDRFRSKNSSSIEEIDHTESEHFPPINFQTGGSCVSWNLGYYQQGFYQARVNNWTPDYDNEEHLLDPLFLYNLTNKGKDVGSVYSDVTRVINHLGVSEWASTEWDIDPSGEGYWEVFPDDEFPNAEAFQNAPENRSDEPEGNHVRESAAAYYIHIQDDEDVQAIQELLKEGYVATISINAYEYSSLDEDGVWTEKNYTPEERSSDEDGTNHANTIIGFIE